MARLRQAMLGRRADGRPRGRPPSRRDDGWTPPTWDEVVAPALGAGLPAGLPADRQPARRRGPHPGGLRPGVPLAVQLHARAPSRAGCTGSPPTCSSTWRGASSGSGSRASPTTPRERLRRPGAARPAQAFDDATSTPTSRPRSTRSGARVPRGRRAVRHRGPVLRGDRRHPRRQAGHRAQPHPPRPRPAAGGARAPRPRATNPPRPSRERA